MSNLIVLIDPNDNNLEEVVSEVNTSKPSTVWVGCSTSSGDEVKKVIDSLEVPISLYPGNVDQIIKNHEAANKVYISNPLFHVPQKIRKLFSEVIQYGENTFNDKMEVMNYVLLHHNSTAAKILGLKQTPTSREVLEALENSAIHDSIYLEGGSRNRRHNLDGRVGMIKTIKDNYDADNIIYGGGISTQREIETLQHLGVDVLLSNTIHENPNQLENYMKLFEN